jgi:hypothetical protein
VVKYLKPQRALREKKQFALMLAPTHSLGVGKIIQTIKMDLMETHTIAKYALHTMKKSVAFVTLLI